MANFIEVKTNNGMAMVNLDSVSCVIDDEDGVSIYFVSDAEDYINTTETYKEIRSKIAFLCKGYYANETD